MNEEIKQNSKNSVSESNKKSNLLKRLLIATLGLSFIIIAFTVTFYYTSGILNYSGTINKDYFGIFGDFIGGVIGTILSAITIILIYITYEAQRKETSEILSRMEDEFKVNMK